MYIVVFCDSMAFMHVHAIALYAHTDYGRQYCLAPFLPHQTVAS